MATLLSDLRFAARSLRKSPGFTAVALLTIALGIGFNSANFSLVHKLLVRPLDLPDLDRLVMIQSRGPKDVQFQDDDAAPRSWLDWQNETRSYQALAASQFWSANLTGSGVPEQIIAYQVSPEFFSLLQVPAALGRTFAPDEVAGKNDKVAVLSDGLWRRRYGSDPSIVGRSIVIDGSSYAVIGVMPKSFRYPGPASLWAPLALSPEQRASRGLRLLSVIGRLRPGTSLAQADAEIRGIGDRHARLYPAFDGGRRLRTVELARGITEDITRTFIFTLVGAAGFVLLIVCANIANLLLARGSTRRREMAVRAALGAGRGRLVRQLLTESLLLSLLAGGLSLLVASWSLDFIKAGIPPTTTRFIAGWDNMVVDTPVLVFTLALAIVTALVFGLAPALQASGTQIGEVLKESGRAATGGRSMQRLRSLLVVVQVSLALILLIGAGVLVKAFIRAANPHRGLDPDGVLAMQLALPESRYDDPKVVEFQRRALAELRAIPGVVDAAAVNNIPWGNFGWRRSFTVAGHPVPRPEDMPSADYRPMTPNYLALLRVPVRAGRPLTTADDRPDAEPVALISEAAAQRYWPGEDPVGGHFQIGGQGRSFTVVGVVGDVYNHFDRKAPPTVYVPFSVTPPSTLYFALRTEGDPLALANSARAAVNRIDGELPVAQIRPLVQALAERTSGFRLGSTLMAALAVVALLLAMVGIYGVIAYLVAQREHEIGVRLALGAQPRQVLQLVMSRGVVVTAIGIALGLPAALGVVRVMEAGLHDLVDADAIVFVVFTVVVGGMALLGTFLPARRATLIDPMIALRNE